MHFLRIFAHFSRTLRTLRTLTWRALYRRIFRRFLRTCYALFTSFYALCTLYPVYSHFTHFLIFFTHFLSTFYVLCAFYPVWALCALFAHAAHLTICTVRICSLTPTYCSLTSTFLFPDTDVPVLWLMFPATVVCSLTPSTLPWSTSHSFVQGWTKLFLAALNVPYALPFQSIWVMPIFAKMQVCI